MAVKDSPESLLQAYQCFAVGCASRVGSIVSIYLGHLGDSSAAIPVTQCVDASWRDLSGVTDDDRMRRHMVPLIGPILERVSSSEIPAKAAVGYAIKAAQVLATEWESDFPDFSKVSALSLAVAMEFDAHGIEPPSHHPSWSVFELQEQLSSMAQVNQIPQALGEDAIFNLRMSSGAASMNYLRSMQKWLETPYRLP